MHTSLPALIYRICKLMLMSVMLFLLSCSSQTDLPDTHFTEYQKRLARVLDVNLDSIPSHPQVIAVDLGIVSPRQRERILVESDQTMSFFDFLRMDNCDLKRIVSERNNQLGKHLQPANGILYEIQVRQALADCIPHETSSTLQMRLKKAQRLKQKSIGRDLWRYSVGSEWFGTYTSTSVTPLAWDDTETLLSSIQAWDVLNQIVLPRLADVQKGQLADVAAIEKDVSQQGSKTLVAQKQHLNHAIQTLESSQAMGRLQVSILMVINELTMANQLLERADPANMCMQQAGGKRVPAKRMTYLNNVVTNHFAKDIQVYLARISREGQELVSAQQVLIDVLSRQIHMELDGLEAKDKEVIQQRLRALTAYQQQLQEALKLFQQHIRSHVTQIQRVRQLCHGV